MNRFVEASFDRQREEWKRERARLRKEIAELKAQLEAVKDRECVWTKTIMGNYGEYDCWSTACGEDFAIEEEWHERPTKFCANCGGKTRAAIGEGNQVK